ncbi:ribonuclease Y [Candidatus Sumerlaeota bacterium]|nr:ribonuclease Y [Candidatus Sumerlaeota bacterium]
MSPEAIVLLLIAGLLCGFVIGYYLRKVRAEKIIQSARDEASRILKEAEEEVVRKKKEYLLEAKEEIYREQRKREREFKRRSAELNRRENKLQNRENALERKLETLEKRERALTDKERSIDAKLKELKRKETELDNLRSQTEKRLEEISGLTTEEAKKLLLESLENEVKQEAAGIIRRLETETKEIANKKARQIITLAIQKCATETVTETTVSVVPLPNEEMKGRIIGREGRNIRALEAATGCNIIVDDTPEAVVLSSFDPLRREVARRALEKLISDGRIHPARIEEIVAKTEREVEDLTRDIGEQVAFDLGVYELNSELLKLIGRLKFRTSYGQNVLAHSIEVAHLAGVMASELGADVKTAKRAGLLHDIGKAVSYEMEGTHALIGAELAKKYNESPAVVHAIAAHHGEEEFRTVVAVLVQAADTISAARPGARRETLESYVKRLEKLEEIAYSFEGVAKSYAIQAGREVRIIVEPDRLTDNECAKLARDVTKRVEKELEYPGQIKVVVLRETRATEYAR